MVASIRRISSVRHALALALLSLLSGCVTHVDEAAIGDPREAASTFYTSMRDLHIEGLPQGGAWRSLLPRLTPELAAAFQEARRQQKVFLKMNPGDKAPWIEGDLFSSLFEGPQAFVIRPAKVSGPVAEVPVELTFTDRGHTQRWTDTLILHQTPRGWLLQDVRYGGKWPFAPSGSLLEVLTSEGC